MIDSSGSQIDSQLHKMADKKEVNQAKLQALTSGAKKKSPFQKQLEQIEAKKKVPHPNPLSIVRLLIVSCTCSQLKPNGRFI